MKETALWTKLSQLSERPQVDSLESVKRNQRLICSIDWDYSRQKLLVGWAQTRKHLFRAKFAQRLHFSLERKVHYLSFKPATFGTLFSCLQIRASSDNQWSNQCVAWREAIETDSMAPNSITQEEKIFTEFLLGESICQSAYRTSLGMSMAGKVACLICWRAGNLVVCRSDC